MTVRIVGPGITSRIADAVANAIQDSMDMIAHLIR
jgi:hypothetical protein